MAATKKGFAEEFAEAFQRAMKADYAEYANAPTMKKVDGLVDVIDSDDRNLELLPKEIAYARSIQATKTEGDEK